MTAAATLSFKVSFNAKRAPVARAGVNSGNETTMKPIAPLGRPVAPTTAAGVTSGRVHAQPRHCNDERRRQRGDPLRLARQLALAHRVEAAIESGELRDCAHAAERFGISRARMSQIMSLGLLSPAIQESILDGRLAVTEHDLRPVAESSSWRAQGRKLDRLAPGWRRFERDASDRDPSPSPRSPTPPPPPHPPETEIPRP